MAAAPRYVYSDYVGGAPRPVRATFVESGAVTVPDDEGPVVLVLPRPRLLQKSTGNPASFLRSWVQRF